MPVKRSNLDPVLRIAGIVLLVLWAAWWWQSVIAGRLVGGELTWVPAWRFLGVDFLHSFLSVKHWLAGGNPYLEDFGDPVGLLYNFPPINLPLFGWTAPLDFVPAALTWAFAIAAIMAGAAWRAWRSRQELGLTPVPLPLVIAVVMGSTPVLFAMERGNTDALVMLLLLGCTASLNGRSWWRDAMAGTCLALAAWVKLYPGLAIPGLLALGRRRAFIAAVIAGLVIGLVPLRYTLQFAKNASDVAATWRIEVVTYAHSISGYWAPLADAINLPALKVIPGTIVAAALLAPLAVWVSLPVYRSPRRDQLIFPYLVWLTQATTFWNPIAYDYKLIFLPVALLALWDRRDPWFVHLLALPVLLYLQPLAMPIGPWVLFVVKLMALVGIGMMVRRRAVGAAAVVTRAAPP